MARCSLFVLKVPLYTNQPSVSTLYVTPGCRGILGITSSIPKFPGMKNPSRNEFPTYRLLVILFCYLFSVSIHPSIAFERH